MYNNSEKVKKGAKILGRERVRQYACFTPEQQKMYASLTTSQRTYIDRRGEGHNRSAAYRLSGFNTKFPAQAANIFEKKHPEVIGLINTIYGQRKIEELAEDESDTKKQIDALAIKGVADKVDAVVKSGDTNNADRIKFYLDVRNGSIKTVRKTVKKDKDGHTTGTTIEYVSDIAYRIQAQKELDKIFGLNQVVDMGKLQIGQITVNVVDASKQEELEDSRNTIKLDPGEVEIIDGEEVVVVEEKGAEPNGDSGSK